MVRCPWRLVVIVSACLSLPGCVWSVGGHAVAGPQARSLRTGSTGAMLPTDAELSAALNDTVTSTAPPTKGGPEVLQAITATPSDCVGVTSPMTKDAFAAASVREVAFRVTSRGTLGALTLGSPWQAQSLFSTLAAEWRQCLGKIALYAGGGPVYAITSVDATDTMLTAAVIGSGRVRQPGLALDQRALVVVANCIVDVQISRPWRRTEGPPTANQAVEVAHLIVAKAIGGS